MENQQFGSSKRAEASTDTSQNYTETDLMQSFPTLLEACERDNLSLVQSHLRTEDVNLTEKVAGTEWTPL